MDSALARIAEWLWSPAAPMLALMYLGLFGIQIGRFQIHGIVTSIWVGAQALAGIYGRFERVDKRLERIENKLDAAIDSRADKDSIRFSIAK